SDITPVIIAPGNNNKPEMSAEYPLASCIYIGINKDGPIKDIIVNTLITVVKANVLYLNTMLFNNGFVNFNCLVRNITIVTIPITNDTLTFSDAHHTLPALLKPQNRAPNPTVDHITEGITKRTTFAIEILPKEFATKPKATTANRMIQ